MLEFAGWWSQAEGSFLNLCAITGQSVVWFGTADSKVVKEGEGGDGGVCGGKGGVLFFKSTWHFNKLLHPENSDKQDLASLPQHRLSIVGYAVDPYPGSTGQTL